MILYAYICVACRVIPMMFGICSLFGETFLRQASGTPGVHASAQRGGKPSLRWFCELWYCYTIVVLFPNMVRIQLEFSTKDPNIRQLQKWAHRVHKAPGNTSNPSPRHTCHKMTLTWPLLNWESALFIFSTLPIAIFVWCSCIWYAVVILQNKQHSKQICASLRDGM